jgi:hypothetical protein
VAGIECVVCKLRSQRRDLGHPHPAEDTQQQQIPLHASRQAGRGPRFGNDRKKGKSNSNGNSKNKSNGKNGFAISFELRVSSCELTADSLRE